jgi:uncharacterized membrane protein YgcG
VAGLESGGFSIRPRFEEITMRRLRNLLIVAVAAVGSACIYERDVIREQPVVSAPPPPPPADGQSDSSYQADSNYQTRASLPPAGSEIDDNAVFYTGLSPYGSWTYVAPYGRVWVPAVGYGWRPYYYGQWVLTDWGWTFVSDDPWGWAAYHYGRWNWGVGFGWYWIPGRVWGPAWVSWRYGGGYAAWCPLGPEGVYFGYRHPAWVAVPEQHFTRPIPRAAVPVSATAGVVTRAQPLNGPHATPIARSGAFGPPVSGIQRAVGQPIARVQVSQAVSRPQASASTGAPSAGPMRSPVTPRARVNPPGDSVRTPARVAPARPAPRPYTGSPPRSGWQGAPRSSGGGMRSYGGGGGVRGYGGGGNGGAPSQGGGGHAAPAPSAPRTGGGPHAGTKSK